MENIFQPCITLGKEVRKRILSNSYPMHTFKISYRKHRQIMEILGVTNNKLKMEILEYRIIPTKLK